MITLKEALTVGRLQEAEILTGLGGLNRTIQGATIMDIPDIADWLSGGELVFAGVLFKQYFSKSLVDSFLEKGAACIATKRKFIASIPDELFDYCQEVDLPVILVPEDCSWGQIMMPLTTYMVQKPYRLIEETQNFHFTIMQAIIEGISLSDMCTRMHDSIGMSFAIMDDDLHLIGFSGDFDWKEQTRNATTDKIQYAEYSVGSDDENHIYFYTYSNLLLRSIHKKIILSPVIFNHKQYGYVSIAVDDDMKQLSPLDIMKVQQLGLFVALHSTMRNEISNATRRFNGLLMDQLLSGEERSQEEVEQLLAPMDKKIHRTYYAAHFAYEGLRDMDSFVRRNSMLGQFYNTLEERMELSKHIIIFEKSEAQVLLIPHPTDDLENVVLRIRDIFIETTSLAHVYVGISDPTPLTNIVPAFQQAERAAQYLLRSRREKPCFYYHDLGVLKFFMDNRGRLDETFLRQTYERYITPLVEYDKRHHTQLLDTLELYLNNNCSKVETQRQLFLHKNTLRARLQTIGRVLDCDVDNTEDLFQIQLASKLRFYFEN